MLLKATRHFHWLAILPLVVLLVACGDEEDDPYQGWETYENYELGFSFRYPADFERDYLLDGYIEAYAERSMKYIGFYGRGLSWDIVIVDLPRQDPQERAQRQMDELAPTGRWLHKPSLTRTDGGNVLLWYAEAESTDSAVVWAFAYSAYSTVFVVINGTKADVEDALETAELLFRSIDF